jgi:hypothetical protein
LPTHRCASPFSTDYNATVAAGEGIGLGKALAAHDKAHNLGRINYMSLYNQ